jgi:hypothetical protein
MVVGVLKAIGDKGVVGIDVSWPEKTTSGNVGVLGGGGVEAVGWVVGRASTRD